VGSRRELNRFDLAGPDGVKHPPLPAEAFDDLVQSVARRAFDIAGDTGPEFIELAHRQACPSLVERQRQLTDRPFDLIRVSYAAGLAHRASKLGYATRTVEFEHRLEPDYNPHLQQFMHRAHAQQTLGSDWFATLCGAARLLLRAAHKEADPGDTARLLKPVGIGPRAQRDLCAWELGAQINDSAAEEAMKEITDAELADCWGYGYYLRACEMSLPPEATPALASASGP
jgi:hypothetical protein